MAELQENNIEWYTGDATATVSFTQRKWVNKMKKYADEYDEVEIAAENEDGSICAHVPVSWIKISPPRKGREYTENEKAEIAERFRLAREEKQKK